MNPDFHQIDSAVDGVTVWAPRPEEEHGHTQQMVKCPRCGATVAFGIEASALTCSYCDYTEDRADAVVGRDAAQNPFTAEALAAGEQGLGVERRVLHCETCAGDVAVAAGEITASCPFCGSNHVNVTDTAETQFRPQFVIPFAIQPSELVERTRKWLGRGWIHPSALAGAAAVDQFQGVYVPFWCFSARLDNQWKAQVGYERKVTYRDSNGNTRTRTTIDWKWEDGSNSVPLENLFVPGTSSLSHTLMGRVDNYNMDALEAYTPDVIAGWQASLYDLNLPDAWERGRARMREAAKNACHGQIRGQHVRHFTMTADFEEEAWRYMLLPVWVSAFQFRGRSWVVLVNGQTGAVNGQKPVAWWKIWLSALAALTPGLFTAVCLGIPLLFAGGIGLAPLIIGAVFLFFGGVWFKGLYQRAVEAEAP